MSTKSKRMVLCLVLVLFLSSMGWSEDLGLEDINFPTDSRIVVDDLKQIPRLAEILKSDPDLLVEIEGHADSTGAQEYNTGLSFDRADAIKKILVENGVASERIDIKGYGEDRPKADNETREGRFMNRRAVFNIYRIKDGKRDYLYQDNLLVKPLEVVRPAAGKPAPATQARQAEVLGAPQVVEILNGKMGSLSVGVGSDDGDFAGAMEGRLFFPFQDMFAFQGGFRGNINDTVKEYQLDAGMLGRHKRVQLGMFGSMKYADINDYDDTASLSQLALVASYLFDKGSVGAFLTEAIDSEDDISSDQRYVSSDLVITETCLKVRDKYGLNFDYTFETDLFVNGELGIVRADDDEATGTLRVGYPVVPGVAVFVQGSYNDGYLEDHDNYMVVAGIELGNWNRKKSGVKEIRPMQVPQVAYERVSKTYIREDGGQVNQRPEISDISSSPVGGQPLVLSFTGHATDPDGAIVSYSWDFGDGTTGSGNPIDHRFPSSRNYTVTLTVTDNDGGTASGSVLVQPPFFP